MLYIGTSGYSYNDWIGTFYNTGTKKGQMLEEYSKSFKFTEINSTYYSLPNRFMTSNFVQKTPDNFKFTIKLHGSMTHSRDAGGYEYRKFNEALAPLIESNKVGCLVAQFPYSFHMSGANMGYIKRVKEQFCKVPLCVEFRNSRWLIGDTYKMLSKENIGFICVDEPNIEGLAQKVSVVTTSIGYIRLHGRNSQKWYNHKHSYERYDYLYSQNELDEWVPKIHFVRKNTDITFIAFNNHFRAQSAINASMLQRFLQNDL